MSSGEETLTRDVVFDVLSSARRRQVLRLLKVEGPMELTELAEHVAAWENDTTVEELTRQQRKRVYVSLYQTHIPKMEDAGLVEYDQESAVVSLEPPAAEVDRYLGPDEWYRWQFVYLVVAAVGFVLIVLSNTDLPVVGGLSQTVIAFALAGAIALIAVAHLAVWIRRRPDALRR